MDAKRRRMGDTRTQHLKFVHTPHRDRAEQQSNSAEIFLDFEKILEDGKIRDPFYRKCGTRVFSGCECFYADTQRLEVTHILVQVLGTVLHCTVHLKLSWCTALESHTHTGSSSGKCVALYTALEIMPMHNAWKSHAYEVKCWDRCCTEQCTWSYADAQRLKVTRIRGQKPETVLCCTLHLKLRWYTALESHAHTGPSARNCCTVHCTWNYADAWRLKVTRIRGQSAENCVALYTALEITLMHSAWSHTHMESSVENDVALYSALEVTPMHYTWKSHVYGVKCWKLCCAVHCTWNYADAWHLKVTHIQGQSAGNCVVLYTALEITLMHSAWSHTHMGSSVGNNVALHNALEITLMHSAWSHTHMGSSVENDVALYNALEVTPMHNTWKSHAYGVKCRELCCAVHCTRNDADARHLKVTHILGQVLGTMLHLKFGS